MPSLLPRFLISCLAYARLLTSMPKALMKTYPGVLPELLVVQQWLWFFVWDRHSLEVSRPSQAGRVGFGLNQRAIKPISDVFLSTNQRATVRILEPNQQRS